METLQGTLDQINIDYACRALLGGGKGKSVMEELKQANPAYYEQIMSEARRQMEAKMSSYPSCRECGNDLTTSDEQEQELCQACQAQKGGERWP
ncbi:hypothetical protein ES706_04780 [subsurface metagenome]